MKSVFLEHVSSITATETVLSEELPGQSDPWVMLHAPGDAIAYLTIGSTLEMQPNLHIQADISGRHYDKAHVVIALLELLQKRLGGSISSDA